MSRPVTVAEAAARLRQAENILLLMHQYPDGDAIGCGYGLAFALEALGKRVKPLCADAIPPKYDYLTDGAQFPDFEPAFICAVDVADPKLLGSLADLGRAADLCIDHHAAHVDYAKERLLDASCGAAAMVVYQVIEALGVELDTRMAECLYTGIATDTGCFKYQNTTPLAHRMAADLMERGVRHGFINELMFDRKSRARIELERMALDGMRYFLDGRCAVMTVTNEMMQKAAATENDMEGLAPIPRQIEGVWVGVTLRQKADGNYKVSIRTGAMADASAIAAKLGGGGHRGAAGCTVSGTADEAIAAVLSAVEASINV